MARPTDQLTVRRVVDRVIDALGPDATPDEVSRTAADVLERIGRSSVGGVVILVDVPRSGEMPPAGLPDGFWIRSATDLPTRETLRAASAAVDRLTRSAEAAGRICLAVGPETPGMPLDWIPDFLEREQRLHVAVAVSRPGLGVDRPLLDRLLRVHSSLSGGTARRLVAACTRLPVSRSGHSRLEALLPGPEAPVGYPPAELGATAMLSVPYTASSGAWIELRAWRRLFGPQVGAINGLRVDGWPADGVRPFGTSPLAATPDEIASVLASLACGCAHAPVLIAPPATKDNGQHA